MHQKIAIQGVKGAFHDRAAHLFFGDDIEIVPALTFEALVAAVLEGRADSAVMAIENTIAGSLLANYNLLYHHDLHIKGEVGLRIRQNLMTLPGVKIEDLTEVHSHPVALAQCERFFEDYPHIRLVESHDTAASAAEIAANQYQNRGAIASDWAATIYNLEVIAPSIETYRANYTRFLAIDRHNIMNHLSNKASLSLIVSHQPGSLHQVLEVLATAGANLTKIQSLPLPEHPFEYQFFIDFTTEYPVDMNPIIESVKAVTHQVKVLGLYLSGKVYEC